MKCLLEGKHFLYYMKTILVIGASGTIGKALCSNFKEEEIITAGRNNRNSIQLDFSDFESILQSVRVLKDKDIDIVFLNSGTYLPKQFTRDGIEQNFMINAFGPYYFLKQFIKSHKACKIVLTSSISIKKAQLNFDPNPWRFIYRNTKLLELMLIKKLEEGDPLNQYCYVHPGICKSPLSTSLHSKFIGWWISKLGNSLDNICEIFTYALMTDECRDVWICPKGMFHLRGKGKKVKLKKNLNLEDTIVNKILQIEQELEVKYGI